MTMLDEPDSQTGPSSCPMIGVIAVYSSSTRTDTTSLGAWLEQLTPVQAPVGAPPSASQLMKMCPSPIEPNGVVMRFAAVRASDLRLGDPEVTPAGHTGPLAAPQAVSAEPSQPASTEACRAASRAAWDTTLFS